MNFYKHHIGDYAQATAHLTFVEDAAYSRMLRKYYAEEKPLPADVKDVQRLVGARTREEKAAVESVLREFFTLAEDGWHNKRADAELAEQMESDRERQEKAENERERQRRHREERRVLFEKLRALDIVPAWDTKTETLRAMLQQRAWNVDDTPPVTPPVTVTETDQSQPVTPPVTRTATANQTPDARRQTPDTKGKDKPKAAAAAEAFTPPDWVPADDWRAFDEHRRKAKKPMTERAKQLVVIELDKLRKAGHQPGPVLQQSIRRGWLDVFPIKGDQLPSQGQAPTWRNTTNTV